MQIGEVAIVVGRSRDTLKRWDEQGLLVPRRDHRGQRVYDLADVERAHELARVALRAQFSAKKMATVLNEMTPQQLTLL